MIWFIIYSALSYIVMVTLGIIALRNPSIRAFHFGASVTLMLFAPITLPIFLIMGAYIEIQELGVRMKMKEELRKRV